MSVLEVTFEDVISTTVCVYVCVRVCGVGVLVCVWCWCVCVCVYVWGVVSLVVAKFIITGNL